MAQPDDRFRPLIAALPLALALALQPMASHATTNVQVRADASAGAVINPIEGKNHDSPANQHLSAAVFNTVTNGQGQGTGAATGDVALGVLTTRNDAAAFASADPDFSGAGSALGRSQISWSDRLTVSSASYVGSGLLNVSVMLLAVGSNTAQAAGNALSVGSFDASANLTVFSSPSQPALVFSAATSQRGGVDPAVINTVNGVPMASVLGAWSVPIPFTIGQPFDLLAGISSQARATAAFGNSAAAGVGLQLVWAGIASASVPNSLLGGMDSAGADVTITDFTVTGASGTDWRQSLAVPEPTSGLLMMAGLGLLALCARRRGSHGKAPSLEGPPLRGL